MNFELELLTTAIIVSSVLHIKAEYNGAQHSGNPYYERSGLGASSAVGTSANIICCVRRDFILNFRRTAGLESISDEIQIHAIFIWDTYYVAQCALAMSLGQPNVYYLS